MNNSGLLLVISGPAGAEKDKVISEFLQKHKEIDKEISYTTREKRNGEVDGEEYNFLSTKEFFKKVDQGIFLEWAEVYEGVYYGTPKHNLLRKLKEGKSVLVEVDIKGALKIKENYSEAIMIIILPESKEVMKNNIIKDNNDTSDNLERKFNSAYNYIQPISKYTYAIVNGNIDDVIQKIDSIMEAEKCKVERISFQQ